MKKALSYAVACTLLAGESFAEPVSIQTGEHNTYTRVVITFSPEAEWKLGRSDGGYTLRLDTSDGFNTDDFFRPIPKDRISGVSQNPATGELELQTGCDCHARVLTELGDFLVVDIVDGPAESESPYERRLEPMMASGEPSTGTYRPENAALFPVVISTDDEAVSSEVLEGLPSETERSPTPVESQANASIAEDLLELEQSIVESLARGLSQGLLESELTAPNPQAQTTDSVLAALDSLNEIAPGLEATTSVDRQAVPDNPFVPVTQDGEACLPTSYFDIGSWGDDRPFAAQIAETRAALTSEFDRLDEGAVENLAKRYLYFGFGKEAIQVLALDGVNSQNRQYLTAIGNIMDSDPFDRTLFASQVSCPSAVALWAILAGTHEGLDAQIDRPAILTTFKALPLHLQPLLGPRLSERFLSIGDSDGAIQALAPVHTEAAPTLEGDVATVALTRALGNEDDANERLTELATTDPRVTPDLMIDFFTQAVVDGLPITENDFILADALRFENEGTPEALDLAVIQVRAYLSNDLFIRASELLDEIENEIAQNDYATLKDEFAATASQSMDDAAFLEFAFDADTEGLSPAVQNQLAERLLVSGFPEKAAEIVSIDQSDETGNNRRLLKASAYVELGRAQAAIDELLGLEGAQADGIRAIANDQLAFSPVVPDNSFAAPSIEARWRQGDWQSLLSADDTLLSKATEAYLEQDLATLDPDQPLASGLALIEKSEQSRQVLSALLGRFEAPSNF